MIPSTVRANLKTALAPVVTRVFDYVPDQVPTPCAVVGNLTITFDEAQNRGLDMGEVDVLVIVSRMNDRGAQDKLDAFLAGSGAGSVKAALETDRTLSGALATLRVVRAAPITIEVAGVTFFAYQYEVVLHG
jgi:hypothetical protein